MVKLFFAGIAVCIFVVVGGFAALFTPLMGGVNRNLGGSPQSPFHSPIPQPVADAVTNLFGQATPSVLLIGALGISALLCIYTIGALVSQMARRAKERRARLDELRAQGRITAARAQEVNAPVQSSNGPISPSEFETIWE